MSRPADNGKILQFRQAGDFFYRRGTSKLESNDLPEAMAYYRRALRLEPGNGEYKLALAELLTETGRYEESNCLLFNGFGEADRPAEAYFGMGCNFLSLRDFDYAVDSFHKYLDAEPEGDYADDAFDMLAAFDDIPSGGVLHTTSTLEAVRLTEVGRELIDAGDMKAAIGVLEDAVKADPRWYPAYNHLALACFCSHRMKPAAECVAAVLGADPANLQANCNYVLIAAAAKDEEGIEKGIDALSKLAPEDPDDIARIALVYIELKRFDDARTALTKVLSLRPYDTEANHRMALCAYELGDYRSAMLVYDKLCKMDDTDTVARFYLNMCRRAAEKGKRNGVIQPSYQVPYGEIVARSKRIWDYIRLTPEEQRCRWNDNPDMLSLITWGMSLSERDMKLGMLYILNNVGGADAERLLRDMALMRTQSIEIKEHIIKVLYTIGAKEPYIAYIDGRLVESRVSAVEIENDGLPRSYRMVLPLCAGMLRAADSEDCIELAAEKWTKYTAALEKLPPLAKPRVVAFAAALEYLAREGGGKMLSVDEVCVVYGITKIRFKNAYMQMMKVLGDSE